MHVHWHEGLFLQPHHLQLMQRRLLTEVRAARRLFSPYAYGVLESRLSQDDLADGRVRFDKLRVILESGQEVFFPEDAKLPALDIRQQIARGAGPWEIVLAVPLWSGNQANSFRQGEPADARVKLLYIPDEARNVADENTGENPQAVHIRKVNARVAFKEEDFSNMEVLPLLRVLRATGEGQAQARLDPDFVPPSLWLQSSPILHGLVHDLAAQLNANREQFRLKLAAGGHNPDVKWDLTLRLTVLNRFCGILPSLVDADDARVSPFILYLHLREMLGELLALNPKRETFDCAAYNHLDPYPCFRELDRKIREETRVSPSNPPLLVQFTLERPGLMRATLEDQHFTRASAYYLGFKTRLDRTKLALYVTNGDKFKMMPRSMDGGMMASRGVELKEQPFPPLDLPAANDLHYFTVVTSSMPSRWDAIKREKAVSLVWNSADLDLAGTTVTLFMPVAAS